MLRPARVRVSLRPDGYFPQAIRWEGRTLQVIGVERVRTFGLERRYRLRTPEGICELSFDTATRLWAMRRSPSWIERLLANIKSTPRYPLPAWRRRSRVAPPVIKVTQAGGDHAKRLALVR